MAHYNLKDGVYLVRGALNGAILDTNTGNVYSVNSDAVSVITGATPDTPYWELLAKAGLANKSVTPQTNVNDIPRQTDIKLKFVWFEIISDDCNESCVQCYADSMPPSHRQPTNKAGDRSSTKLSYSRWIELIEEAYALGCRSCQFIGGEPFLYRDSGKTVLDLATHAKKVGYGRVEIFTNGTLLTKRKIATIKKLDLVMAISVYSNNASVHDSITQTPGSHSKTMMNIRRLKEAGVQTRISTVIMRHNQADIESTVTAMKDVGVDGHKLDPLRPKGRGENQLLSPDADTLIKYGYMTSANFTASKTKLAHYAGGHSCLAGKVTITDSGDVLPCIFSRSNVMGNTMSMTLEEVILRKTVQRIWHATKDNVQVCRDCEYRYVCFDCRPLSEAASNGNSDYLRAPYPRCTYNPYTGEWATGVWRVDEQSTPWYDRSVALTISKAIADSHPSDYQDQSSH